MKKGYVARVNVVRVFKHRDAVAEVRVDINHLKQRLKRAKRGIAFGPEIRMIFMQVEKELLERLVVEVNKTDEPY